MCANVNLLFPEQFEWSLRWLITIHYEMTIIRFHGACRLQGRAVLASQHLRITQPCQESLNKSAPLLSSLFTISSAAARLRWLPVKFHRGMVPYCCLANWNYRRAGLTLDELLLRQYYTGSKALSSVNTHGARPFHNCCYRNRSEINAWRSPESGNWLSTIVLRKGERLLLMCLNRGLYFVPIANSFPLSFCLRQGRLHDFWLTLGVSN